MLEVAVWTGVGMLAGAGVITAAVLLRRRQTALAAAWQHLVTELERARRYDRPFAVARLSSSSDTTDLLLPSGGASWPLGLRRTDHFWPVGPDLYVVLPEADRDAALRWVRRISDANEHSDVVIRLACFPADGQTAGGLLAALHDHPATAGRIRAVTGDARWAS